MGNCGCKGESHEIDDYLKSNIAQELIAIIGHHKPQIKAEKDNYELSKQDREEGDQNLVVRDSDLKRYLDKKGRNSQVNGREGDQAADGEEINEDLLREMCMLSNLSTSNGSAKQGGLPPFRPKQEKSGLQSGTQKIQENYEISLDTDVGTDGRPRFKEEIKLPPQYESIDLNDPNDDVLFQGELVKYKAGLNPSYLNRWVQVTEKSFRYFKGRCNAITCCNKPLTAIPVLAIKKVERVNFSLFFNKKEQDRASQFNGNQFEIFLKDDFIDIYLRPEYEQRIANGHGHSHSHIHGVNESKIQGSPQRNSNFYASSHSLLNADPNRTSSPSRVKHGSPGKVRGQGGESHPFTAPEMKQRFLNLEEGQRYSNLQDKIMQSVNTQGSWSNREEEWFFTNKRLLFSTKSSEITDQWVEKLSALVTSD